MVGVAEWPAAGQAVVAEEARDRGDHAHAQCFLWRKRRQNAGQARGQHRLAGARRADHQQVVAAGCGELEGALGGFLPLDVAQVGIVRGRRQRRRPGRRLKLRALEVIDERQQVGRRHDFAAAGPGGLGTVGRRADQAALAGVGADGGRQHARDRYQRAVEAELAERDVGREIVRRQHLHGHQQAERDGEIEVAALLLHVRRREVHGDPPHRHGQPEPGERAAHPLPAFRHRLVGETHHRERRHARADVNLHVDRQRLDALEGDGLDVGNHAASGLTRPLDVRRAYVLGRLHIRIGMIAQPPQ